MEKIKFLEEQIQAQNIIDDALKELPLIDKITLFMLKNKIKEEDYQFLIKKLNEDVRNNEQSFLNFYLDRKRVVRKLEKQINKIKKEEFDKLKVGITLK